MITKFKAHSGAKKSAKIQRLLNNLVKHHNKKFEVKRIKIYTEEHKHIPLNRSTMSNFFNINIESYNVSMNKLSSIIFTYIKEKSELLSIPILYEDVEEKTFDGTFSSIAFYFDYFDDIVNIVKQLTVEKLDLLMNTDKYNL